MTKICNVGRLRVWVIHDMNLSKITLCNWLAVSILSNWANSSCNLQWLVKEKIKDKLSSDAKNFQRNFAVRNQAAIEQRESWKPANSILQQEVRQWETVTWKQIAWLIDWLINCFTAHQHRKAISAKKRC